MEHKLTVKLDANRMPYLEIDPPINGLNIIYLDQTVTVEIPDAPETDTQ